MSKAPLHPAAAAAPVQRTLESEPHLSSQQSLFPNSLPKMEQSQVRTKRLSDAEIREHMQRATQLANEAAGLTKTDEGYLDEHGELVEGAPF